MATGIEHRGIDTILQSYDYFEELPNWAIYAAKDQRAYYNGGNKDQGGSKLGELLNMIEAASTQTVYTLRMYPEHITDIKSNTPHQASTTFMLNANVPVTKDANGLTIIDRTSSNAGANNSLMARLNTLEAELQHERELRHKAELKALEDKFEHRIAGLTSAAEEKGWTDRIIGVVESNPQIIDTVLGRVENIFTRLFNVLDKNRPNNPAPQYTPINGTDAPDPEPTPQPKTEPMAQTTTHEAEQQELTDEQIEKIHDQQNEFMEEIEEKLGVIPLTLILEKMAKDPLYLNFLQKLATDPVFPVQLQSVNTIVATVGNDTATKILQKFSAKDAGQMKTALTFL